jgi:hypothetical protein
MFTVKEEYKHEKSKQNLSSWVFFHDEVKFSVFDHNVR